MKKPTCAADRSHQWRYTPSNQSSVLRVVHTSNDHVVCYLKILNMLFVCTSGRRFIGHAYIERPKSHQGRFVISQLGARVSCIVCEDSEPKTFELITCASQALNPKPLTLVYVLPLSHGLVATHQIEHALYCGGRCIRNRDLV